MAKTIFITATDTHVGKTVATAVIATLLKKAGKRVGVLKPVQCAGDDAARLKKILGLPQPLSVINPIYAPEPLSPHLALKRAGKMFDLKAVRQSLKEVEKDNDIVLIEGAGGLLVPLKGNYTNADLARDIADEAIIISRLGLGTINHTLLTVEAARLHHLKIKGMVFSDTRAGAKSVAERTNPGEIAKLTDVKVLGTIPFLKTLSTAAILRKCPAALISKI